MNNKKKTWGLVIVFMLIALTIGFIWNNSIPNIATSAGISNGFLEFFRPVLKFLLPEKLLNSNGIRKTAHFVEFFLLGAEFAALLLILRARSLKNALLLLGAGLAVACVDETIQIFAFRGSSVKDVWLDTCGALCGIVAVLLIAFIVQKIKEKKKQK